MKMPTEQEIYDFCKDHYYCDEDEDGRAKWQPFEDWEDDAIEELIDNDVWALTRFLKGLYGNGEVKFSKV